MQVTNPEDYKQRILDMLDWGFTKAQIRYLLGIQRRSLDRALIRWGRRPTPEETQLTEIRRNAATKRHPVALEDCLLIPDDQLE